MIPSNRRVPLQWFSLQRMALMLDFDVSSVRAWWRAGRFGPPPGEPEADFFFVVGKGRGADGMTTDIGARNWPWLRTVYLTAWTQPDTDYEVQNPCWDWPFSMAWWKPSKDPVRNLVKAGALIAAEIDRLQRLAAKRKGRRR